MMFYRIQNILSLLLYWSSEYIFKNSSLEIFCLRKSKCLTPEWLTNLGFLIVLSKIMC